MSQEQQAPDTPRKTASKSRKAKAEEIAQAVALQASRKKHLADLVKLNKASVDLLKLFNTINCDNLLDDCKTDPLASTVRNFHNKTAEHLNVLIQHIALATIVFSNDDDFADSVSVAKQISTRLHANRMQNKI